MLSLLDSELRKLDLSSLEGKSVEVVLARLLFVESKVLQLFDKFFLVLTVDAIEASLILFSDVDMLKCPGN